MGNEQRRQLNETNGPDGPREADLRQQLSDHTREDKSTCRTTTGRDTKHERSPLQKVCGQDGHQGTEHAAGRKAHAEALGEKELPVLGAERGGEDAADLKDGPDDEDNSEEASIDEATGESANKEEKEDGDGADPGDIAGGEVKEIHIVGLEGTERVDPAPEQVSRRRVPGCEEAYHVLVTTR